MRRLLCLAIACLMAAPASAVVLDGSIAGDGYTLAETQTVQTGFGDEDGLNDANGGELNAAYLKIEGGRLYIAITGNLETDSFNKLSLFIDSRAGGENTLSAAPNYDFGDVSGNLGLISFQSGFNPDFHLFARAGNGNFEVDIVDRLGGAGTNVLASTGSAALSGLFGVAVGATGAGTPNGSGVIGPAVASSVGFALDNSNTAGVIGGSAAANQAAAQAVTTGAEFSIALSDLGAGIGDTICIVAGYSNGDYNFWSNQFLGGLPAPQNNLGADGNGNFFQDASNIPLDLTRVTPFCVTVVPEPSSIALIGLSMLGLAMRRR